MFFFFSSLFVIGFFSSILSLQLPNSTLKTYNYTYDCTFVFDMPCHLQNLTFANEVFSNSFETDVEKMNEFIEDSYMFKKKFKLKNTSNKTDIPEFQMILSEDVEANETIAVFFSEEEVLHSQSFGRAYMRSFEDVDSHQQYPHLILKAYDISLSLTLLYHLYHIEHSKFEKNLRLLPRLLDIPGLSLSEYELNLLGKYSVAYNHTINIRAMAQAKYENLIETMNKKWTQKEIKSFLNGRDEIPPQDFLYALIIVFSRSWISVYEKKNLLYFPPVLMHLANSNSSKGANKATLYKYLTNRDIYSTKVKIRFDHKENDALLNDFYEIRTENLLILNSHVPKVNYYDCIIIRVMPEYVAKDWMNSTGESCFSRDNDDEYVNYQIVNLHMNMDEEELYKCEKILSRLQGKETDAKEKQEVFLRKCPFSGYNKVDMWNHTFNTIEEEVRPNIKEKIKKGREYLKLRKELGLNIRNAELIVRFWESKIVLLEDVILKMKQVRENSLARLKNKKEAERMSRQKSFAEEKIEL